MLILLHLDPSDKLCPFTLPTSTLSSTGTVFTGLHTAVLAANYQNVPSLFIRIGMPLLFIFFGNVMGQIRHNYFVGIRSPGP